LRPLLSWCHPEDLSKQQAAHALRTIAVLAVLAEKYACLAGSGKLA